MFNRNKRRPRSLTARAFIKSDQTTRKIYFDLLTNRRQMPLTSLEFGLALLQSDQAASLPNKDALVGACLAFMGDPGSEAQTTEELDRVWRKVGMDPSLQNLTAVDWIDQLTNDSSTEFSQALSKYSARSTEK